MKRWLLVAVGAITAAAIILLASIAFWPRHSADRTVSGNYGAGDRIPVVNRSLEAGSYWIKYRMSVFLKSERDVTVTCSVYDSNDTIGFFEGMSRQVAPGRWVDLDVDNYYVLPDITVGLRCAPDAASALTIVFRDVEFTTEPSP